MLDYVALGLLVFVGLTLFYRIIVIDNISYEIARHRHHPHQDAIPVAVMRKILLRMTRWMNYLFPFH